MTRTYTIVVPGVARGKARPRVTRTGHAYTPQTTRDAEAHVKACALAQAGKPLLSGPLCVEMLVYVMVPASWTQKKRVDALAGNVWPTVKPDIDNNAKLVADSLNGIMWHDDAQIVRLVAEKRYAAEPETIITVRGMLE